MAGAGVKIKYTDKICMELPPIVNSRGDWDADKNHYDFPKFEFYPLPQLQLQLLMFFAVTQATHFILKRAGLPTFTSQFVAGIILGPLFIGRSEVFKKAIYSHESQRVTETMAGFGFMLYMFLSGVKMDVSMVNKTGKKAWAIGIAALVAPLASCLVIQSVMGSRLKLTKLESGGVIIMETTEAITSFPVIATLLTELKILNSELGRLSLSAALTSQLCGAATILLVKTAQIYVTRSAHEAIITLISYVGFVLLVTFVIHPAMLWIMRQTPEGKPVRDMYAYFVIILVFAFVGIANRYIRFGIIGAFIMGLAIPAGPPLGSAIVTKLDMYLMNVLYPLVGILSAMRADLLHIGLKADITKFIVVVSAVNFLTKAIVCFVIPRLCKFPLRDAFAVAFIMSAKGVPEMAAYVALRDRKMVPNEGYVALVLSIFVKATVVPVLVKFLYDPSRKYAGYQKRNIMHLKTIDELRVLLCILRPDNVPTFINFFDIFNPTEENPITCYILHLMEQVGQSSPIFVSHQIQKRTVSNYSYSGDIIRSFNYYKQDNQLDFMNLSFFTAISPSNMMNEDICNLALDKLTNIIVLPFHKKWTMDGAIVSESKMIRALNCSVLERAPCSVGILVDHGLFGLPNSHNQSRSVYQVAMIFLGGKDDREALTLAKLMARDPRVCLTVVHLVATDHDDDVKGWAAMLDSVVLRDVKDLSSRSNNVKYFKERVDNGSETAALLQSMVDQYDIFIVGRQYQKRFCQTECLAEWSDFPELGALGDLLTSFEFNSKASVLVVQQQQMDENKY